MVQAEKPTSTCSFLSLLTFVLGSIRLTPYLLMAIKRISGKFGSVVCWQRKMGNHETWGSRAGRESI
jgi:hypothetical protein